MTTKEVNFTVHHVARIEGHGNIIVNAKDGKIEECKWEVPESPRFFESMLRGLSYSDVNFIAPRICGICAVAHANASITAVEAAFGVKPTEQYSLLRDTLFDAETFTSHVLHTYFLVAPDFFNVGSVIPLAATHTDVVLRALRLKKFGNDWADILCGRKTHPISQVAGGFVKLPTVEQLKWIKDKLEGEVMQDMAITVDLFKTLKFPDFTRETEYIALTKPDEYAFILGMIGSSDCKPVPINDYLSMTNEFCVPQSTAKWTKHLRESYQVGALARFNVNHDKLHPKAKKVAQELGLKAPCHNPYFISVAQLVETMHTVENSIMVLDKLLSKGIKPEKPEVKVKAGRGVGAVEAPRGILFHDYTFDDDGKCIAANIIIPTNENHNSIQHDFNKLLPEIIDKPQDEIKKLMEMLVRAYDPCVSCSTHMLEVKFK
ncbi:MAG: Ni/Fe hydrogenase subunit alpha [Dehalococcoidia bacterium]|nr:Ni/Fe hydrogenase subunit alpha [Dehalococcoidia bacterium]MDD5494915.1 Ni/Fe hydrogenase subunit alpha [Dehalococcoidia bacterium]